ncbi:unnamed protein product [Sphenostylis stenocarpa]|uniref:F-box domain-containing protein n=1 Tax=Sphenostylis stenocarpa TaxID=92480 RepID=A0AA86T1A5_9FABA|nr:unnamed protein product [Sphenostylis stenocarpa]
MGRSRVLRKQSIEESVRWFLECKNKVEAKLWVTQHSRSRKCQSTIATIKDESQMFQRKLILPRVRTRRYKQISSEMKDGAQCFNILTQMEGTNNNQMSDIPPIQFMFPLLGGKGTMISMELQDLPEGCIAKILSYTSPMDASRFSLVSKAFCSAAESDSVWGGFLPILASTFPPSSFPFSSSKKDLYFNLCNHPTIIDQGKKSVQLDKRTGKKCYMLSARNLDIIWGDTVQHWEWTILPESRFQVVAVLRAVCWFDISGRINTLALSSNTHYAAFLVFKMINASGFHYHPTVLSVGISGGSTNTKYVCLDLNLNNNRLTELQCPKVRSDGWLEIEMGEFFNSGLEEDQVQMRVMETTSHILKCGFILEGIEIRLKHV